MGFTSGDLIQSGFRFECQFEKSNKRNGIKRGREKEQMKLDEREIQNKSERTKGGKRKVAFSKKVQ